MKRQKVAIIGAGINGLSCAYQLAKKSNYQVSIFDVGTIPCPNSASYGDHRLIHPWSADQSKSTYDKAVAARSNWQSMLVDIGSDCFAQTGVVAVCRRTSQSASFPDIACSEGQTNGLKGSPSGPAQRDFKSFYNFPEFGILFAEKILRRLVKFLKSQDVTFYENHCVKSVDSKSGKIWFSNQKYHHFDRLILSAGIGTEKILNASTLTTPKPAIKFLAARCYITYLDTTRAILPDNFPAWAALEGRDFWGMPPIAGIPMKLGCGEFTRLCDFGAADDSKAVSIKMLQKYSELYPWFKQCEIIGAGMSHWAKINSNLNFQKLDPFVILVTSDNGQGFKFAPLVASEISDALSEAALPRVRTH